MGLWPPLCKPNSTATEYGRKWLAAKAPPLGSLMQVRKAVQAGYAASSDFRAQRNGCPLHEPVLPIKYALRPGETCAACYQIRIIGWKLPPRCCFGFGLEQLVRTAHREVRV
jgi:hypothetical protein